MLIKFTFAHAAGTPTVTIVALGDSTTAGTPFFVSPAESPPNGSGDPQGAYAYWMMHKRPNWNVINCGINGQRSDEIRDRLNDLLDRYHPQYVIILAGVNDIYQGVDLKIVGTNLAWMYGRALDTGAIPVASTVPPFDRATPEQTAAINALNKWIRKTSDKYRIPLAELHDAVADPQHPERLNGSPDGLHPDIGGYRQMGLVYVKTIDEMEASHPPR